MKAYGAGNIIKIPRIVSSEFVLFYVRYNGFGSFVKLPRILYYVFEGSQSRRIVITVTDTLVEGKSKIHVVSFLYHSGSVHFIGAPFRPESKENGTGSEVIQMMINRRNPERAHRRNKI